MRAPALRALGFLCARPNQHAAALVLEPPARRDERTRRATRECLLALEAVRAMLEDGCAEPAAIGGERTALFYATAAAYASSNKRFIEGGGGIHFAYTAPAVVPAEVAIEFGITGPYAIFIGGPPATLRAIWQAAILLDTGACDRALVLAVETFDECAAEYARARRLTSRPLVESAGCLWLERGEGRLAFESRRSESHTRSRQQGRTEMFAGQPLADLDRWRREGQSGWPTLSGSWRGEDARLESREDGLAAEMAGAGGGTTG
jgi:hypothetical protein